MTVSKAHVLKYTVVDSEVTSHRDHSDPLRSITAAMAAQLMSPSQRPRRRNYGCRAVQFLEAPFEKVDPRPETRHKPLHPTVKNTKTLDQFLPELCWGSFL